MDSILKKGLFLVTVTGAITAFPIMAQAADIDDTQDMPTAGIEQVLGECYTSEKTISVKDYLVSPKPSGYTSYHMLVTVPVYLSDRIVDTKVEIQIRTVAMDFWASLEHKIHYKFEGNAPEHIKDELVECAHLVSDLDTRMRLLNEEVQSINQEKEDE